MKIKKIIPIIVILAIIIITIIKLKNNKETVENKIYQYDKELEINVQVDTIKYEKLENDYFYTGTFEPNKETKISAEIQGKITNFLVEEGSTVKKGQSLIQIDNSLLKLQLQAIEIQISGYENDVERYKVLAEADAIQGVQLEKAKLLLEAAYVSKATLEEQIAKTTIVAPFAGIVTDKFSEEGGYASPAVPLIQITDISKLKFTVNVPENELSKFEVAKTFPISSDIYPEISLTGKVILIGSKADMSNTFPVQFSVENSADLKIKAGMFGKVNLKSDDEEKFIIIPASAIKGTTIIPQIYVVKNGKAVLQNIIISERIKDKVIVTSGLTEGDVIITNGFINLFDGANVINSN
jgi:RND family efflux transporter MFP subunit